MQHLGRFKWEKTKPPGMGRKIYHLPKTPELCPLRPFCGSRKAQVPSASKDAPGGQGCLSEAAPGLERFKQAFPPPMGPRKTPLNRMWTTSRQVSTCQFTQNTVFREQQREGCGSMGEPLLYAEKVPVSTPSISIPKDQDSEKQCSL